MVSRESIIKYGTLALILFFIFEAFFPLLYAPQNEVLPEGPTPESVTLVGSGTTMANVTRLEYLGFATCPADAQGDKVLSGKPGIKTAFYSSGGALAVDFEQNASVSNVSEFVEDVCGSLMFRTALLDVDAVVLRDGNKSQPLTREQMRTLASQTGLAGIRGFILPGEILGSRVNVTVSGRVDNGQLSGLAVQQVVRTFEFEPTLVNSTGGSDLVNSSDSDAVELPDVEAASQNDSEDGDVNASDLSVLNASG